MQKKTMRKIFLLIALLLSAPLAAKTVAEYLPAGLQFNPDVPTPESILGWEVADWHVRHDQLVQYLQAVAAASPRVSLEITGYTHEQRPLLLLSITSAGNQNNLESLRKQHLDNSEKGPLVLWQGYSVHGNEASGSNASLLFVYYLAAATDAWLEEVLENTIVLIEPSINPDGLARFAHWANSNKSKSAVADPNNREHNETWPRGRTNHYWFDLNRDWLLLQHPESQARIRNFHRWLPHVLTDFHEQGSDQGYFFQPGVPSRQNPLTPAANLDLTRALAQYHAEALDAAGQPFFSEERFDDFYYGKGSTYPDVNASIGILFEQASARGHVMDTRYGPLPFQKAVSNHLATSLSTLRGAWELRQRLKTYQGSFYQEAAQKARQSDHKAWLVADDNDPERMSAFLEILRQHQITFYPLAESTRAGGIEFNPGSSWVLPVQQKQYLLLEALMERRTEFVDETFYDVSSWTLPLAFNLPNASTSRLPDSAGQAQPDLPATTLEGNAKFYALAWNNYSAPAALQRLLSAELHVQVASKPFSAITASGVLAFSPGTLVVPFSSYSDADKTSAVEALNDILSSHATTVTAISSGLTPTGIDLGSNDLKTVKPVKPLLLTGRESSGYEAGEVWHLLDTRVGLSPVMIDSHQLGRIDIAEYTHLIMVDGEYDSLSESVITTVESWIKNGGILIASKKAATWAESLFQEEEAGDSETTDEAEAKSEPVEKRAYAAFEKDEAQRIIGGAILAATLDLSHPLAYGYQRAELPLFRNSTVLLKPSTNPYATVAHYDEEPLLSGFVGSQRLEELKGQPAMIAERVEKGLVVRIADNPGFRAYWYGTQRLLLNSLFFGQIVEKTELE